MINVTGKLEGVLGAVEVGSVVVKLANFGPQLPAVAGVALIGRALTPDVPVKADGTFTFPVFAQDQITPAGTYYTVTLKDSDGNVIQTAAYRFPSNTPNVDLSIFPPFDPTSIAIPPLPPVITSQIQVVAWSSAPVFDGSAALTFDLTLAGATASPTFVHGVPGNLYTFLLRQPAAAAYLWTPPANMRGSAGLPLQNGLLLAELFVCLADGSLLYLGGALYP